MQNKNNLYRVTIRDHKETNMKKQKESTNQSIVIQLPYSTILLGMDRIVQRPPDSVRFIESMVLVEENEYNLAYAALNFIGMESNSKGCVKSIRDNIMTIKKSKDDTMNRAISNLVKYFVAYEYGPQNNKNKKPVTGYIPFVSTCHIFESLTYLTNLIGEINNEEEEKEEDDITDVDLLDIIKSSKRTILSLKTELFIRDAYTFQLSESLRYAAFINDYKKIRRSLKQYYTIYQKLCNISTIIVEI